MKIIAILTLMILFSLSISFASFNGTVASEVGSEYTSVRNLPVILKNEPLSNDRCRLHLDTGIKIDVKCKNSASLMNQK